MDSDQIHLDVRRSVLCECSRYYQCELVVCAVMATDIDSVTNSQLTYSVSDGNFTVQTVNNVGYIRTAQ